MYINYKEVLKSIFLVALLGALAFVAITCGDAEVEKCGNGTIDAQETCDGTSLGAWTCGSIPAFGKYAGGELGCTTECVLDTSACDSCWGYPCEPDDGYGRLAGEIIEDLSFETGNDVAAEMAMQGVHDRFELSDVYKTSIAHSGRWKHALIFVTTGWCPYCNNEASVLEEAYNKYRDEGILFLSVVAQDATGTTATPEFGRHYAETYGWTFPTVVGDFPLKYWPNQVGYPLNMFIDLEDMKILDSNSGALMSSNDVDLYIQQHRGEQL